MNSQTILIFLSDFKCNWQSFIYQSEDAVQVLDSFDQVVLQTQKSQPWFIRQDRNSFENIKLICCVFQPAFGCCAHPEAGQNTQQMWSPLYITQCSTIHQIFLYHIASFGLLPACPGLWCNTLSSKEWKGTFFVGCFNVCPGIG